MNSRQNSRGWTFLLIAVVAFICIGWRKDTLRDRTLPADCRPEYVLTTFTVKPPTGKAWRLWNRNKTYSFVNFVNADNNAYLSAFWEPVFKQSDPTNTLSAAENYFRERVVKDLEISPDFNVVKVEPGNPESINGINFESWRMKISSTTLQTNKDCDIVVLGHTPAGKADLFLFMAIVPQTNVSYLAECESTLREVVRGARWNDYKPSDVVLSRAAIATARFTSLAEKESKSRDVIKLQRARDNAREEVESASRITPDAPQPWNLLGLLTTYNSDSMRYGNGYDPKLAEELFQHAAKCRPTFTPPHVNLALLYEILGRKEDAEHEYKELVAIEPSSGEFHYELGRFYQKLGREREELDQYREALWFWRGAKEKHRDLRRDIKELKKKFGEK